MVDLEIKGESIESVRKSPLFQELMNQSRKVIEKDKEKGLIFEPKRTWTEVDQREFETIPIEKLLDDPYYGGGDLWPKHREDIIELWRRRKIFGVDTFVDKTGIGGGKTFKVREIMRLLVLELVTKVNPIDYYGVGLSIKSKGMSLILMSRNAKQAKSVTFETLLPAFDCPFFQEYFPPQVDYKKLDATNKRYPSMLRFPKKIVIFPGTGSALSALGYDIFGGVIDEANWMEIIDDSKKSVRSDRSYDAAESIYNAIYARMASRFLKQGRVQGLLAMVSNSKYQGDFLDRMIVRARRDNKIFAVNRCSWEAQPKERFSGKTFSFDVYNRKILETSPN